MIGLNILFAVINPDYYTKLFGTLLLDLDWKKFFFKKLAGIEGWTFFFTGKSEEWRSERTYSLCISACTVRLLANIR